MRSSKPKRASHTVPQGGNSSAAPPDLAASSSPAPRLALGGEATTAQGTADVLRRAMQTSGQAQPMPTSDHAVPGRAAEVAGLASAPIPVDAPPAATGTPHTSPSAGPSVNYSPALRLLQHEAEVRRLPTQAALLQHLCNATAPLVRSDLILVFRRRHGTAAWACVAHSAVPEVDREASLVRALELRLGALSQRGALGTAVAHLLHDRLEDTDQETQTVLAACSTPHAHWVPMPDRDGDVGAGILWLRRQPFGPAEVVLLQRLAETYGHAWLALKRHPRLRLPPVRATRLALAVFVAVVAIGLIPVQRNVMAPLEVAARSPVQITAPLNGAIRTILVAPNQAVKAGDPLVQFEDLTARNEVVLAEQRVAVAHARHATLGAQAFTDANARQELAIAHAELKLARLNLRYAQDVLARSVVRSPADGVALYTDRRDWEGRAVQVGEEIVQVAQPGDVRYRVEMNVSDALALKPGAAVSVYMDNAPLGGYEARVVSVAYTPKQRPGAAESSYTVWAAPTDGETPRIGGRGSARLYGDKAPLAYQLLHRPWSALRQALGY